MLRDLLKVLCLSLALASGVAAAADRADEYLPFTRLTDNYDLHSRKQNYDEYKFPISINKGVKVEGEKTIIEYGYRKSEVNASRLQFKRHFEGLVAKAGGEIVHSGQTDDYHFAVSFKFPKNGKLAWGLASTGDSNDIYHYRLVFVETGETWGGAPAAAAVVQAPAAKPAPEPKPQPAAPVAQVAASEPAAPWNGGDWVEVRFGGCDVPDVRRSKLAVPDADFCDARMNGKVAVCNADRGGCFYKNVTPKQCKDGSLTGRMFVCTPR